MPDSAAAGDVGNAIREGGNRTGDEVQWWRYAGTLPPWMVRGSCIVGGLWMFFFFALAWWVEPAFGIFIGYLGSREDLPAITECFLAISGAVPTRMWEFVGFAGGIGIMVKDRWVSKRVRDIANRTAFYGILISAALVAVAFFWPMLQ